MNLFQLLTSVLIHPFFGKLILLPSFLKTKQHEKDN